MRRAHYTNSMARRQTRQSSHEKINLLMVQNAIGRSGTPSLMELLSGKPGESLLRGRLEGHPKVILTSKLPSHKRTQTVFPPPGSSCFQTNISKYGQLIHYTWTIMAHNGPVSLNTFLSMWQLVSFSSWS